MSYGPSIAALSHRGAYFADKMLKGTKPADLPVEQPSKLHGFVAEPKRSHKKNK